VIYDELKTVRLVLTPQIYPVPGVWYFDAIGINMVSLNF